MSLHLLSLMPGLLSPHPHRTLWVIPPQPQHGHRELCGCQLGTKGMGYKGLPRQGSSTVPTGLSRNLSRSSIKVASVCGMHLSLCQAPQAAHGWHCGLVPLTVQSPAWHMASGSPDWRRTRWHLSGHRPSPNGRGSSDNPMASPWRSDFLPERQGRKQQVQVWMPTTRCRQDGPASVHLTASPLL